MVCWNDAAESAAWCEQKRHTAGSESPSVSIQSAQSSGRLPAGSGTSSSSSSYAPYDESDKEWKWENILNRMEAKIEGTVKLASVMGKQFCKDRTSYNEGTSRECMARLKEGMKVRLDKVLDEIFRADLPSAR